MNTQNQMHTKKMRLAVVGYGGMGSWHAKRIAGQLGSDLDPNEFELAGVYDILPERNAQAVKDGFFAYESFAALLNDKSVDIVTVAIPNDEHMDVCVALMDAGKNVISEKPVCLNVKQLDQCFRAAEKNDVKFTVHQNRRWDPDYLDMMDVMNSGELGGVYRIESRVHGSRGIPGDWRTEKRHGGGMVYDWGIHLIDQMFHAIKSPVKSVYATLCYVTGAECDDGFQITTLFENGLTYYLEVGTNNFVNLPRWYMLGQEGSAVMYDWDHNNGKIAVLKDWEKNDAKPIMAGAGLTKTMAPRTEDTVIEKPLPDIWINASAFYKNFAKACRGEEEQIVKHSEMRRVMKFVETVFDSAAKNKVIADFEDRCQK